MHHKVVYLLFSSGLILSGCSAPDDIKPHSSMATNSVLSASHNLNDEGNYKANWPEMGWWEQYGDSQLSELVVKALENSPNIQLADARLNQAQAFIMQANSALDPTLNASASYSRARLSRIEDYTMQGNRYSTSRSLGLDFNYSFDLWGGKKAQWQAAVNAEKAAEVEHQAAKIELASQVVAQYIQLSNAYALLDLANHDLERSQRIVTISKKLFTHGLTSEEKLFTAQSGEASAERVKKERALAVKKLKNALSILTGTGTDAAASISRPELATQKDVELPDNLTANLLSHRPDITAALWQVKAAVQDIKVAKTQFYPNFNLSAMAGFKSILGDAVFGSVSRSWNVTPAISLPIFTGELKANLYNKTSLYDQAVAQYNKTLLTALGEVVDSIDTLKSIKQQLVDAQRSVELAQKSYHINEKKFDAGMGSQLEVLMSEQRLLDAEAALINLTNQQKLEKVTLVRSLGGGFEDSSGSADVNNKNDK
ncbi:efflux transporter outer membrane subunit [Vibrio sp.]|uniref:Efflux transporter outer membrane subunit n=1 Tax=Vibrio viridaestus TaxID=2487322 RepID=A0A3N9TID6_9VIBR|nr:efflux transporter outer membrane subunit [Vibrio viridaestus]MDC0610697.1 efflux transporter outer membrane subunit [Vibrio sp.]RQW63674.1 efflux transporter outer membrane subunit [Vibrio viridaestus]